MAKKTHYAIIIGRQCNVIVKSWAACSQIVTGYSGAKFQAFTNRVDADNYLKKNISKTKDHVKKITRPTSHTISSDFIPPTDKLDKYGYFKPRYYMSDGIRMADFGKTIGKDYIESDLMTVPF